LQLKRRTLARTSVVRLPTMPAKIGVRVLFAAILQVTVAVVAIAVLVISGEWRRAGWLIPYLLTWIPAAWLGYRSFQHLSDEGRTDRLGLLFRGSFAPRSAFTETGWRLRWQSTGIMIAGFVTSLVFLLLS
jgi:hypothetical protein